MATLAPLPVELATRDRIALADPVFISDLHLADGTPRTLARFERFVAEDATRHAELLILGDLFEAWIGDDALDTPVGARVAAALRAHTEAGRALWLMHGNRDVLLGGAFLAACGGALLADPTVATIQGHRWLLGHGDAWCVDDLPYQRFRAQVRVPAWQRAFLERPRAEREQFVGAARAASEADKRAKPMAIMDVAPAAVDAALHAAGVRDVLHGHTHRPALHAFTLDGAPAQRCVLPDWDFDAAATRGGYVIFSGGAPRAVRLSD